jgi:hypothetical protein
MTDGGTAPPGAAQAPAAAHPIKIGTSRFAQRDILSLDLIQTPPPAAHPA